VSTWILEAEIAAVFVVLLLPLVTLPAVYLHYRRYGRFAGWPAAITLFTLAYVCGLVAFTMFPLPTADTGFCSLRDEISYWQLVPFASIGDVLDVVRSEGLASALSSGVFLQVALNVLLLVPFGMLLAHVYRRSLGFTVVAGLGVSLLIELTQGTGVWGLFGCPYRLADVDDLLTNTTGAALGWLIGTLLGRWLPDPHPDRAPDCDPPGVGRRVFAAALDVLALIVVGLVFQVIVLVAADGWWLDPASEIPGWVLEIIGIAVCGLLLFLAMPILRRDRATPGYLAVWLVTVAVEDRSHPIGPVGAAIRFGIRWSPVVLLATIQPFGALVLVAVVESITVAVRRDRRSLSGVAARSTTVTRLSLELDPFEGGTE
jgi:glycopeptide antibiotics resistance protein